MKITIRWPWPSNKIILYQYADMQNNIFQRLPAAFDSKLCLCDLGYSFTLIRYLLSFNSVFRNYCIQEPCQNWPHQDTEFASLLAPTICIIGYYETETCESYSTRVLNNIAKAKHVSLVAMAERIMPCRMLWWGLLCYSCRELQVSIKYWLIWQQDLWHWNYVLYCRLCAVHLLYPTSDLFYITG